MAASRNTFKQRLLMAAALSAPILMWSHAASAQTGLEEIVVTAQSRTQSLQEVPISVNVVGSEFLAANNIDRLQDVAQRLPSLNIVESATGDQIFMRGIGSGINPGFEQSVATFVDGVYKGRDAQSRERFMDVDRIEVLRGPQSIFFGHNTIAGALSITTKGPSDEFTGYVRGVYGPNDEDYELSAAAGGPLSDTFGYRVAFRAAGRDGFVYNETQRRNEDQQDSVAGRVTLGWTPTDRFNAELKLEYSDFEQTGSPKETVACPTRAPFPSNGSTCATTLALVQAGTISFDSLRNGVSHRGAVPVPGDTVAHPAAQKALIDFVDLKLYTGALKLNYEVFEGHNLSSLTAFAGYEIDRGTDIDNLPIAGAGINDPSEFDQFSQELRFTSPSGRTFEYILGVYYQEADFYSDEIFVFPRRIFPGGLDIQSNTLFDQHEQTQSAFGSLTWNITDRLQVTGGVRFTRVEKDLVFTQSLSRIGDGNPRLAAPRAALDNLTGFGKYNVPRSTFNRTDEDTMPSVNVQYELTDDVRVYAKASQGFKAGGFDQRADRARNLADISFNSEEVDAYEVGAKMRLFDRKVELNVAAFRSDYTDLQVSSLSTSGVSFVVENAGAARSQGVEFDGRWAMGRGFTLSGAASYLDASFTSFSEGPCNALEELTLANGGRVGCALPLPAGQTARNVSRAGGRLPFAPEWSGSVTMDYEAALSDELKFDAGLTAYFTTELFHRIDNDPRLMEEGFVKFDARVGLTKSDRWELSLLAKNIGNEQTTALANRLVGSTSSYYVQQDRDRHFLIQLGYKW